MSICVANIYYIYIYICQKNKDMEWCGGRRAERGLLLYRKDSVVKNNLPRNTPEPESFF